MGLEKDVPPGEQLIALFRPFLESLAASDLAPKTIQKHVDNMWVLGGEFIRLRRSRRMTHFRSLKVTHLENRISV